MKFNKNDLLWIGFFIIAFCILAYIVLYLRAFTKVRFENFTEVVNIKKAWNKNKDAGIEIALGLAGLSILEQKKQEQSNIDSGCNCDQNNSGKCPNLGWASEWSGNQRCNSGCGGGCNSGCGGGCGGGKGSCQKFGDKYDYVLPPLPSTTDTGLKIVGYDVHANSKILPSKKNCSSPSGKDCST